MKTYAEKNNKPVFDWNKGLQTSIEDKDAWDEMNELAADWVTCACGNQCSILSREKDGTPSDSHLATWGRDFGDALVDIYYDVEQYHKSLDQDGYGNPDYFKDEFFEDVEIAKDILNNIEKRSTELLTELYEELQASGWRPN